MSEKCEKGEYDNSDLVFCLEYTPDTGAKTSTECAREGDFRTL